VRLVLIASGRGTDAESIMDAYRQGVLPNIDLRFLISTKTGAECLFKAEALNIPTQVLDYKCYGKEVFEFRVIKSIESAEIQLVFLVGCIVKIPIISGIRMYNIHPAEPKKFGGKGMYGLAVHQKVLEDIFDQIKRGKKSINDRFFTNLTVHEVGVIYDEGQILLQTSVEIPPTLIQQYLLAKSSDESAQQQVYAQMQEFVLPFEHAMLPAAVNLAALQILNLTKIESEL